MADEIIDIEYSFSSKGADQLKAKMKELSQLEKDLENAKKEGSKSDEKIVRNKISSINRQILATKRLIELDDKMIKSKSNATIASQRESEAAARTAQAYSRAKMETVKGEQQKQQEFNKTRASYAKSVDEHFKATQSFIKARVEQASESSKVSAAEARANNELYKSQTSRIKMYQQAMKAQSGYRNSTNQTISANQRYANSLSDLTFNNKLGTAAAIAYLRVIRATQDLFINTSKYILKSAIQMDTMERSMNAIAGSDAPQLLDEAYDIIKTMPIPMNVVADGFRKMYAAGIPPKDIKKNFLALSATASVVGYDVDRLTLAITQMYSKGKVNAQDMRQLAEAGIGPWKLLAEKMGITTEEVQKLSEEGKLGINEINLLIEAMGDKYIPGLGAAIDTLPGQWEIFKNRVATSSTVIQPILDSIKEALKEVNKYLEDGKIEWDELDPTLQKIIITVGLLTTAFVGLKTAMVISNGIASMFKFASAVAQANTALKAGSGLFNVFATASSGGGLTSLAATIAAVGRGISFIGSLINGGLMGAFNMLRNALMAVWGIIQAIAAFFGVSVGWVIVAIVAIVAVIWLLYANWDTVVKFMQDAWNWLVAILIAGWDAVWGFIKPFIDMFIARWSILVNVVYAVFQFIWGIIKVVMVLIWEIISTIILAIVVRFLIIVNVVLFVFNAIWGIIQPIIQFIWDLILNFINAVIVGFKVMWHFIKPTVDQIGEIFSNVFNTVVNVVRGAMETVTRIFNSISDTALRVANSIRDFFTGAVDKIKGAFDGIKNFISGLNPFKLSSEFRLIGVPGEMTGFNQPSEVDNRSITNTQIITRDTPTFSELAKKGYR